MHKLPGGLNALLPRNAVGVVDWSERIERDDLGESRGGLASPLVDKVHRLMALFRGNRATDVQRRYDEWGLASEQAFPPLLQAIRELALQDGNETERPLVEALATQLMLTRRQVVEDGVMKEGPFFQSIDEAMRTRVSYRKQRKQPTNRTNLTNCRNEHESEQGNHLQGGVLPDHWGVL